MRLSIYFLINPNDELRGLLQLPEASKFKDIANEVFWIGDYYDRGPLSIDDLSELTKVLFLNRLRRLRSSDPGFDELFFDFEVTKEYFDKRWTLRCPELETTIEEELEEAFSTGELGAVASSNPRIQEMLGKYQPSRFDRR